MKVEALAIPEVLLITPDKFGDSRGFFSETFNAKKLSVEADIDGPFVQDNHSLSRQKGVIRGLHCQIDPHVQGKLVRVVRGAIWDVAVDARLGSPTFGQYVAAELSAENWQQLWIPGGFLHGFCTLVPDTEVFYKVTNYYSAAHDRGLAWDDEVLGIAWPVAKAQAILSERDRRHPSLRDLATPFE